MRFRFPAGVPAGAHVALAVLAVGAIGGCGGSGGSSAGNGVAEKTPAEILAAAKLAADSAGSVHVSGSIRSGSSSSLGLDLDLLAGRGGSGKLSENGLEFELIQTGGDVYIKGSPAFYRHLGGQAAAQQLQGKWLKVPRSSLEFASISSLTDLRRLLEKTLPAQDALVRGATSTVAGQPVLGVRDSSTGETLYVATRGRPYPIEITQTGSGGGTIVFDRWNEPVSLAAPANAIDLGQLQATR